MSMLMRRAFMSSKPPIAFRSSTTSSTGTISKPSGIVSGDILVLLGSANATGAWSAPSGFTDMFGTTDTGAACYRIADGSEAASVNYVNGAGSLGAVYLAFSGASTVDVIGSPNSVSGVSSLAAPSVSTTVANTMLIAMFSSDAGVTLDAISGMTQVACSTNPPCSAYYAIVAASGATGTRTLTTTGGGSRLVGGMMALRP